MAAAVVPAETVQTPPQTNDEWCREAQRNYDDDNDRESFCEVRQFTIGGGAFSAETSNGSIRVTGERRNDTVVRAMVFTHARTREAARELAKQITVSQNNTIRADGPRSNWSREGWYVSFRIQTPQSADIDLESSNGSLNATDVRGRLRLRTSNGSIRLTNVGGDVQADTSNGSVTATLSGTKWEGEGLDIGTSNGSVRVGIPDNYNARIVASSSNGSINFGFPVTMSGNIGGRRRDIDTTIGSGGPTIRMRTSNGSVSVRRANDMDSRR